MVALVERWPWRAVVVRSSSPTFSAPGANVSVPEYSHSPSVAQPAAGSPAKLTVGCR
jgi:hypothetical protein